MQGKVRKAGFWVRPRRGRDLNYSYKLAFDCTNNEVEYEAMMLAIQILKDFQVRRVAIHWDFDLVIKQIQGEYHARHPTMRSYRNAAQDLIGCFEECKFNLIPILQNCIADSLETSTTVFNIPMHPNRKYEVEVRHIPSFLDNVKS